MTIRFRRGVVSLMLLAAATPAVAQTNSKTELTAPVGSKEDAHQRMRDIASEVTRLRSVGASEREIAVLQCFYDAIRASLGGDEPARTASPSFTPISQSAPQPLAAPACGAALTPIHFTGSTGPILPTPGTPTTFTATISTPSPAFDYLWDLDLRTYITHTSNGDLDITLTSPAGTVVTITTDNGGANDNVFNGTLWDENAPNITVADHVFTNLVTVPTLNSEARMTAFRGEDPNGTWTLTVTDDTPGSTGSVNAWSLDARVLLGPPVGLNGSFTSSPGLVISSSGTPTVTDSMSVFGLGSYLEKLTVYLELPHTYVGDLNLRLASPAGTTVQLTTRNGGSQDNVFDGTTFDDDSTLSPTEVVYVNNVVIPVIGPEGAFDNFLGEDPNGTWILTVFDESDADGGTLVHWELDVTTITAPFVIGPFNALGTTGAIIDPVFAGAPTVFTTAVSGVGTSLWDVDLTTFIAHTSAADLDMTLTSPAGTVVTISTDNGGTNDNVFNGTLWDSNANDGVVDHAYANNVAASPLTPEGSTTAFRGENPNGVWTLTITDDAPASDFGSLNAWTLGIATIPSLPIEALTAVSRAPALAIPDAATVSDSLAVVGAGTSLSGMTLYVEILHTFTADLDITLTSPAGTVLNITSDNGSSFDNVFNGTIFDWETADNVTDHAYANAVVATPLSPETGMDNLLGQNPNGLWTLTLTDDAAASVGSLVRWGLDIKTCGNAGGAFCSNGSLGIDHTTGCPCGNTGLAGNGCGHSFGAGGANMDATGSISADTVVLHSQFEPASSFTLMMQHASPGDAVFHDGVLCAGNPLIRLRGRAAVGGEAYFPDSNFVQDSTTTLSQRGGTFPGSGATRRYSAWFRNASTTFCPPATANVTNGWLVTW